MASILRIDDIENKGTSQPASAEDVRGGVKTDSIAMGRRSFTPEPEKLGSKLSTGRGFVGIDSEPILKK